MNVARLEAVCESIVDCPHSTPEWTKRGVVVLRNNNIRNGRLDLRAPSFTSEAMFLERTKRAVPQQGDIIITREAPMGDVCMIPADLRCCLGQRMVLLRPDRSRVDPRFLLYALQSPPVRQQIRAFEGTGSTVSNLRIPAIAALEVPLPSVTEQLAIARALGALDDKMTLAERIGTKIDQLLMALTYQLLTQAEGDGAGEFEFGQLAEVSRGMPYTGAELGSGLPLHNLNSVREGGGYKRAGLKRFSGRAKERHRVRPGDVVVANVEQGHDNTLIGYPALIPARFGEVGVASQDLFVLRPKDPAALSSNVIYLLLRTEPLRGSVAADRNGTTVSHLPADALRRARVRLPSAEALGEFEEVIVPLLSRIEMDEDQTETLLALRDALLPQLFSRAIRPDKTAA